MATLTLTDAEALRLAALLDREFAPSPTLRAALASLANPKRASLTLYLQPWRWMCDRC